MSIHLFSIAARGWELKYALWYVCFSAVFVFCFRHTKKAVDWIQLTVIPRELCQCLSLNVCVYKNGGWGCKTIIIKSTPYILEYAFFKWMYSWKNWPSSSPARFSDSPVPQLVRFFVLSRPIRGPQFLGDICHYPGKFFWLSSMLSSIEWKFKASRGAFEFFNRFLCDPIIGQSGWRVLWKTLKVTKPLETSFLNGWWPFFSMAYPIEVHIFNFYISNYLSKECNYLGSIFFAEWPNFRIV